MRVGQNPNKGADIVLPDVLCGVVTHLPNMEGYHKERFEIVKLCITSMVENAGRPVALAIWDNGSCGEFRNWIVQEVRPYAVVFSENVGKTNARTGLFRMFPENTIISYSDDDIFYYPNWLVEHLKLLEWFPGVAAVSGWPVRTAQRWGIDNTLEWAVKNATVRTGRFMPREWEDDFAVSIGRDPEAHNEYAKNDIDHIVEFEGLEAYIMAHHCQFVGLAKNINKALLWSDKAMGQQSEKGLDILLDMVGLRLTTTNRVCRHMGNVLDEKLKKEVLEAT